MSMKNKVKLLLFFSPVKADFIRAKYQFLSFLNKSRDTDITSVDDISQVSSYTSLQVWMHTVQPVLKATCIKQSPAFKGHYFRSH